MRQDLMINQYASLPKKRPACFFKQTKTLLIMDTASSHEGDNLLSKLKELNTTIKFIHGCITPFLQFIDIVYRHRLSTSFIDIVYRQSLSTSFIANKLIKVLMKNKWAEWIENGKVEYTRTGKRKRPFYEMVVSWVQQSWKEVSEDMIMKGLRDCGFIEWNGDFFNVLHSRSRETILSKVPMEVILEVEEIILEKERSERGTIDLDDEVDVDDDDDSENDGGDEIEIDEFSDPSSDEQSDEEDIDME